jgi:ribonuclease P protein component
MLKKQHRLAKSKDVQITVKKGRSFFNTLFTLKALPTRSGTVRFTVVVSTKVAKNAVERNRIKRVVREAVRLSLDKLLPSDYALLVKPKAKGLESKILRAEFERLLKPVLKKS